MKAAALLAIVVLQAAAADERPVAKPDALRYERAIQLPRGAGQACAVLDGQVFAHAAPSLVDLRIFPVVGQSVPGQHEVPYAITLSEPATQETQPARLLNLGSAGGKIAFDLEMPGRAYTDVTLDIDPAVKDFLAAATVTGKNALGPGGSREKSVYLGTFTLFDLSSQRLSRDTTLPLEESTFRYLHIVLSVTAAPGAGSPPAALFVPAMVLGAEVPPSREAQTVYTTVAETSSIRTVGRESRATFDVVSRVPVERVAFDLAPGFNSNFSRDVRVTAVPDKTSGNRPALAETVDGTILRVHATEAGREIRSAELGVPATLGANLQSNAKVQVAIENGDDQPLPIAAVRLEMRERAICFQVPAAGEQLALYYGDSRLAAPVYDYDRLFVPSGKALVAELGPERMNPAYQAPAPDHQAFTQRHPEVLWIALLGVICALGLVALRSAKDAVQR
jgi:hypothetical protein